MPSIYDSPITAQVEPLLMLTRRAFPEAQRRLASPPQRLVAAALPVTWFGAATYPETAGSIAVVRADGTLTDLVGDVLRVTSIWPGGSSTVFVWVVGSAGIDAELSLARRAFLELALLSTERAICKVEVVS